MTGVGVMLAGISSTQYGVFIMAIQAVISDIGGVLLKQVDHSNIRKWEQRLKLKEGELLKVIDRSGLSGPATLGKITAGELWQRIGERLGLNEIEIQDLEQDFWSGKELNTELSNFLQDLRPQRRIATISNTWSDAREILSRKYNLDKLVDTLIFSYEVGFAKPDVRIFQIALYRLGLSPEEIVYLDDTIANVDSARLPGMQAIHYRNNEQAIAEIEKLLNRP
jgi:epoxide hydrolase-like predicted phosphatase